MLRPSLKQVGAQHVNVFIAEASPLDCQLLADSLGGRHLRVVGWAVNCSELVAAIAVENPDVTLISSRMQDGELAGFQALTRIRNSGSKTRVVMLLNDSDPELVVAAFRGGASGVFSRKRRSTELRKCIRCVSAGEIWARNQEMFFVVEALQKPATPHISNSQGVALLTRREGDVVALAVSGLSNRQIAHELGLSQHTVKNYMFEIFEKLGISTRVELVLYALNHRAPNLAQRQPQIEGLEEDKLKKTSEQEPQVVLFA